MNRVNRRRFLQFSALSTVASFLPTHGLFANPIAKNPEKTAPILTKEIPTTKAKLPVIGMGTWITFNVGKSEKLRDARTELLKEFFALGGGMIDSSPMYGSAEEVVGYGLKKLEFPKALFSATKIWTSSASEGVQQVRDAERLWGVKTFDLLQVHNLDGWEHHLKLLFKMKKEGKLRHIGITTSHGRRHDEVEKLMRTQPLDFVQLTYNLADRSVEEKLLPLAQEKGIAVIANRPLDGGDLFQKSKGKPLPPWAAEIGCANWAQFFLKFVVSHPAMTCAIPATSQLAHLRENMGAAQGPLPDSTYRQKMIQHFSGL